MGEKYGDRVDVDPWGLGLCRVAVSRLLAPIPKCGLASTREGRFYRSQARRRLQIAALAGVVGFLMLAGMTIPAGYWPRLFAFSWIGVVLFGAWTIALAIADVVAIWFFFEEDRQEHAAQSVALRYKMEKFQEESLRACEEAVKKAQTEEKVREERK